MRADPVTGSEMVARIWRAEIEPTRVREFRRFIDEHSVPMFRARAGLVSVLFLFRDESESVVISLWESRTAVDALERSGAYRDTVARLESSGMVLAMRDAEVLDVHRVLGAEPQGSEG